MSSSFAGHLLWSLSRLPLPSPDACISCGYAQSTNATPVTTPHILRWHIVVFGFGTGIHTFSNRTQHVNLCAYCTQRCTVSANQAMRMLLFAAVGEYIPSLTRGPPEAPDQLPWVATTGCAQSVVVLFDKHCRYLRADVDALAARPGWGSYSIERIDFTTHREALLWRMARSKVR